MHSTFCPWLTSPQTLPVFTALLLEPFLDPQMCMNSFFLIFLLVSLSGPKIHIHTKTKKARKLNCIILVFIPDSRLRIEWIGCKVLLDVWLYFSTVLEIKACQKGFCIINCFWTSRILVIHLWSSNPPNWIG